ncbi:Type II secretion system protein E [Pirellulimonas nuda]|uniref:Type II secretion system protein E n=1 Tax=Pirellulimonas nuda TaxID=2528009 RepID=A0A518D5U4_9BACT|nr:ATPase, T2SS/T4P/T4SS family [Pirellulimonas nuda]QDU86842.1 Type II secretion system protein E [Pirellulimonas nuda]
MHDLIWRLLLAAVVAVVCIGGSATCRAQEEPDAAAEGEAPPTDAPEEGPEAGPEAAPNAEPEAEPAPPAGGDKWNDTHSYPRLTSPAASPIKLIIAAVLMLVWVGTSDWVNRDAQQYDLGVGQWNATTYFPGLVAGLMFLLPFLVASPVAFLAWIVPFGLYVAHHNRRLEEHQRVLTKDWMAFQMRALAGKLGMKVAAEKQADYEKGAPVQLKALGGDETKNNANLILARKSPGYVLVKDMVADMVANRSGRLLMDFSAEGVAVRRQVDGVWHAGEPRDRESGDVLLAVIKQLANLNPAERRKAQSGMFSAEYQGTKYACSVESQGVKTGERVSLGCRSSKQKMLTTLAELGMREKTAEQWAEVCAAQHGTIVIASMPEGGLTTLTDVSLMETDRLMREFLAVEDVHAPEQELENIGVFTYDSKKGETPATPLPKLIRKYPDAYVVRDLVDEASTQAYLGQVAEGKLLVTTINARDACEAPLRMIQKYKSQAAIADNLSAVICMRLIRTLCEACKVGFEPAPELLAKLGIPAGKLTMLYREPTAEEIKKPCPKCAGSFFVGRTGLFELIVVDDTFRKALKTQPKPEILRKVARQGGMRTFQEEGIVLLAKGGTSLAELQRILKT